MLLLQENYFCPLICCYSLWDVKEPSRCYVVAVILKQFEQLALFDAQSTTESRISNPFWGFQLSTEPAASTSKSNTPADTEQLNLSPTHEGAERNTAPWVQQEEWVPPPIPAILTVWGCTAVKPAPCFHTEPGSSAEPQPPIWVRAFPSKLTLKRESQTLLMLSKLMIVLSRRSLLASQQNPVSMQHMLLLGTTTSSVNQLAASPPAPLPTEWWARTTLEADTTHRRACALGIQGTLLRWPQRAKPSQVTNKQVLNDPESPFCEAF